MFNAKEKLKTNVGEYIIYMFQIEDLIRASKFDHLWIEKNIVGKYSVDEKQKKEIKSWYLGLAELMEEEKITETGHLSFLNNKIIELFDFHLFMMQSDKYKEYQKQYNNTLSEIKDFSERQKTKDNNIVLLLVNAIYGFHLLKLSKKEVSDSTQSAITKFYLLLQKISEHFKDYETGKTKVFED